MRFAEVQFLTQPLECCDFISNLINEATWGLSALQVTGAYENLKPVKLWSEDEAVSLEKSGFRESYLPVDLLGGPFGGSLYKANGPQLREARRAKLVADVAAREAEQLREVARMRSLEWSRRDRYSNGENDLPF